MRYAYMLLMLGFLCSCEKNTNKPGLVDAYVPIYGNPTELRMVAQQPARPIVNGGKIAVIGNYLFQVEDGSGIHIIDISNPTVPQKKSFIKIPLCTEVSLKGNLLYTNNVNDLIVMDISDLNNVSLVSRTDNAFPAGEILFPPQTGVYFECVEAGKGPVISWELKQVNNPKCKR